MTRANLAANGRIAMTVVDPTTDRKGAAVSELEVALRSIMPAFQGVIPSPVATADANGMPNITYVSLARFLDDERIAISNQFLGKTSRNLDVNPSLTVRVVDPETLLEYDLHSTRVRSERAGEPFDSMRVQIDAIADQTGMAGVFRLRAVEVLRVDQCALVEGSVGRRLRQRSEPAVLDGLSVFVSRLGNCRELGELTQTALELLDDLFAMDSSMLLMADTAARSLFVIAHHGCGQPGAWSVRHRRRPVARSHRGSHRHEHRPVGDLCR